MEYSKKASNCKLLLLDGYYTRKKAIIYLLPDSATVGRPSSRYVGTVLQGYKDMGFDTDYLYDSLDYNLKEVK